MAQQDYSALDTPEILSFIFYPRGDYTRTPTNASDHSIPVDNDASISCRFYTHSQGSPSIIYFHGNGEVVSDYDYIAPMYSELGINLFVQTTEAMVQVEADLLLAIWLQTPMLYLRLLLTSCVKVNTAIVFL